MAAEIRALTGVRGIGAGLIVVYHFGKVQLDRVHNVWPIPHGYMMVDRFFMLSGFVIALGYQDAFRDHALKNYGTFLIKRFARLYPAYIVICGLFVLKMALHWSGDETLDRFGLYDVVGNVLMLSGWGLHIYPVIGVAWAASAELGSYVLLPVLLLVTIRWGVVMCGLGIVASLATIYGISVSGLGYSGPLDVVEASSVLPLARAIAGFTLGLAIFRFAGRLTLLSMAVQDALLAVVLIAVVLAAVLTVNDLPLYVLFIPLVALLSQDTPLALMLFGNRLVYHLGVISYSIYLLHPLFVRQTALTARYFGAGELAFALSSLVAFGLIWALSYASYLVVEMPGRKLLTGLLLPKKAPDGRSISAATPT
jgi:peptidoglycan/LPS O-acetylase OafA/YrhL